MNTIERVTTLGADELEHLLKGTLCTASDWWGEQCEDMSRVVVQSVCLHEHVMPWMPTCAIHLMVLRMGLGAICCDPCYPNHACESAFYVQWEGEEDLLSRVWV